jgi:DNA-binding transcriptional regulator LsrR (DeoR family)
VGQSQRAIARELDIDRRKVRRILTKQHDSTEQAWSSATVRHCTY